MAASSGRVNSLDKDRTKLTEFKYATKGKSRKQGIISRLFERDSPPATPQGSGGTFSFGKSKDADNGGGATDDVAADEAPTPKAPFLVQLPDPKLWMPDKSCDVCYHCERQFRAYRRRHHCRVCGQIFCDACSSARISGAPYGKKGQLRVCDHCFSVVRQQEANTRVRLRALSFYDLRKAVDNEDAVDVEPTQGAAQQVTGAAGPDAENPLKDNDAVADEDTVSPVNEEDEDGSAQADMLGGDDDEELWHFDHKLQSTSMADMITSGRVLPSSANSTAGLSSAHSGRAEVSVSRRASNLDEVRFMDNEFRTTTSLERERDHEVVRLRRVAESHLIFVIRKLLAVEALPAEWEDVVLQFARRACMNLRPSVRHGDSMDILNFVHIRTIPGGDISECHYLDGVVFRRNIAHKKMRMRISNPKVLLFSCALEFQRTENKLVSLEMLQKQESEYIDRLVQKIASLEPDIVVVEKTVSRLAQELLRKQNISLVLNVRPDTMRRVARATQAQILPSPDYVDTVTGMGKLKVLGSCGKFAVKQFKEEDDDNTGKVVRGRKRVSQFVFFEQCTSSLHCTMLLRGASKHTLKRVKKVLCLALQVGYSLRLETAFLIDEFAAYVEAGDDERRSVSASSASAAGVPTPSPMDPTPLTTVVEDQDDDTTKASSTVTSDASASVGKDDDQDAITESVIGRAESQRGAQGRLLGLPEFDSPVIGPVKSGKLQQSVSTPFLLQKAASHAHIQAVARHQRPAVPGVGKAGALTLKPGGLPSHQQGGIRPPKLTRSNSMHLVARKSLFVPVSTSPFITMTPRQVLPYITAPKPPPPKAGQLAGRSPVATRSPSTTTASTTNPPPLALTSEEEDERLAEAVEEAKAALPWLQSRIVFNSCWITSTWQCLPPTVKGIQFYQSSDQTLGQFLNRFCFNTQQRCMNHRCREEVIDHEYSFMHYDGRIVVRVSRSPVVVQVNNKPNNIIMWSLCLKCRKVTPSVVMSTDTYNFSFGKFLDLSFYNHSAVCRLRSCSHRVHVDHVRFFARGNLVASFQYSRKAPFSVVVEKRLRYAPSTVTQREEELITLMRIVHAVVQQFVFKVAAVDADWQDVREGRRQKLCRQKLLKLNQKISSEKEDVTRLINGMIARSRGELAGLLPHASSPNKADDGIVWLPESLFSPVVLSTVNTMPVAVFEVANIKRRIFDRVCEWNATLQRLWRDYQDATIGPLRAAKQEADNRSRLMATFAPLQEQKTHKPQRSMTTSSVIEEAPDEDELLQHGDSSDDEDKAGSRASGALLMTRAKLAKLLRGARPAPLEKKWKKARPVPLVDPRDVRSANNSPLPVEVDVISKARGKRKSILAYETLRHMQEKRSQQRKHTRRLSLSQPASPVELMLDASPNAFNTNSPAPTTATGPSTSSTATGSPATTVVNGDSGTSSSRPRDMSTAAVNALKIISGAAKQKMKGKSKKGKSNAAAHASRLIPSVTMEDLLLNAPDPDALRFLDPNGACHLYLPRCVGSPSLILPVYEDEPSSVIAYALCSRQHNAVLEGLKADAVRPKQKNSVVSPLQRARLLSSESLVTADATKDTSSPKTPPAQLLHESASGARVYSTAPASGHEAKSVADIRPFSLEHEWSLVQPHVQLDADASTDPSNASPPMKPAHSNSDAAPKAKRPDDDVRRSFIRMLLLDKDTREFTYQFTDNNVMHIPSAAGGARSVGSRASVADRAAAHAGNDEEQIDRTHCVRSPNKSTKFTVTAYYPKQFHALRLFCCGSELNFVQSMARCMKWDASGGKSGSTFSRTADGRFVLKYIKGSEAKMFLDFALDYFDYMAKVCFESLPSVLVKILGVYRVGWKRANKEQMSSQYLFVMPNLFCNRTIERVFDLKGSQRNRYVKTEEKQDTVTSDDLADKEKEDKGDDDDEEDLEDKRTLLDVNLMEFTAGYPLSLDVPSKRVLQHSVYNDTKFLCSQTVVDYSLLVGIEKGTKRLVVGIIDYVRKYTWDKAVEQGVKSMGMVVGQARPTIQAPEDYKKRFREAMERYFMVVPDQVSMLPWRPFRTSAPMARQHDEKAFDESFK